MQGQTDLTPMRRTLSGILHSKHWTLIFTSINVYILTSGQDTDWYSFCSAQEKCVSLAQPYKYNRQLIQFARIPVEFVVHFIRYQNCMKVIINYTFHGCLVSAFNIFVQLMFTRSQSTMLRPVHRVHFITVSLG